MTRPRARFSNLLPRGRLEGVTAVAVDDKIMFTDPSLLYVVLARYLRRAGALEKSKCILPPASSFFFKY